MKLVVVVVQGSDVDRLLEALVSHGFRATQINSSGGFLREQNVTLLVGVDDGDVPAVREIVRQNCHARTRFVNPLMPIVEPGEFYAPSPIEVLVGGATLFVLDVVRFERIPTAAIA
jgi:uncharacterized protein YaaQ